MYYCLSTTTYRNITVFFIHIFMTLYTHHILSHAFSICYPILVEHPPHVWSWSSYDEYDEEDDNDLNLHSWKILWKKDHNTNFHTSTSTLTSSMKFKKTSVKRTCTQRNEKKRTWDEMGFQLLSFFYLYSSLLGKICVVVIFIVESLLCKSIAQETEGNDYAFPHTRSIAFLR